MVNELKGLKVQPIFSKHKKFKNCKGKIKVNKIFEDYNTLRIICPDAGGFNLAIRVVLKEDPLIKPRRLILLKRYIKKRNIKLNLKLKKCFK